MFRKYFYILTTVSIAIIALASCSNSSNTVPGPVQTTNVQPTSQPLNFSKPQKLDFNKLKTVKASVVIRKLDIKALPARPYDTAVLKPFSNPVRENKLDFNALPSKSLDLDKLPSKPLRYKIYILPSPSVVKAGIPRLKNPNNPFIYGIGAIQGISGTIRNFIKDNDGFLWILTDQYLYRYDGESLFRYLQTSNDYYMTVDGQNRLWLSKYNEIDILDIKKGTISIIDAVAEMGNDNVLAVYADRQSRIWVAAGASSIQVIDLKKGTIKSIGLEKGIIQRFCRSIDEDSQNRIWLPTLGGGVEIIDPANKKISFLDKAYGIADDSVVSVTAGKEAGVWLTGVGNTLNIVEPEKNLIKSISEVSKDSQFTFELFNDKSGNAWLCTNSGLEMLDTARRLKRYFYASNGLAGNVVQQALQDKAGQIWIATNTGLSIISQDEHIVEHITNAPTTSSAEDSQGLLWQATPYDGFNIIDRKNKTIRHFGTEDGLASDSLQSVRVLDGLIFLGTNKGLDIVDETKNTLTHIGSARGGDPQVSAIAKDNTGRLWMGVIDGIGIYEPQKNTMKFIGKAEGLIDNNIIDIIPDTLGHIWISTFRGGISVIDAQKGTMRFLNNVRGFDASPKNFIKDKNGNIWISYEKGIFIVDLKRDKLLKVLTGNTGSNDPISTILQKNGVFYASAVDRVYIITPPASTADYYKGITVESYGINKINTTFFQTDAISRDGLFYWADAGITVLDPSKKSSFVPEVYVSGIVIKDTLKNFADRLRDDISETDTLWAQDGSQYTTGEDLFPKTDLLKKAVSYDSVSGPYHMPVNLSLPYNQNYISLNYASFGKAEADSALYQYILTGADARWNAPTTSTSSRVYYGLAPGKYTFEVSRLTENEWGKPAVFSFVINPPWWQTWWAWLFYIILLTGVVWCFVYYRSKQLIMANRLLEQKIHLRTEEVLQQKEEIEAQRDSLEATVSELKLTQTQLIQSEKMASLGELTAGIAHEIQNPLNFINNFSEVSMELSVEMKEELAGGNITDAIAIADDIENNLQKVINHGKRADSIVKSMLQHSRASSNAKEPTDVNKLADEYLRLAYHGLRARDKAFNSELTTNFAENLPLVNMVQQDVGRVLLNLFNNSFYTVNEKKKNAGADYKPEVTVTTSAEKDSVIIKVKDNGNGIPDAIKDKIMQPFFTTKPTGDGTGLGLSLSYDIVVKGHGGHINVESKEGEGSEFTITLPVA